MKKAFCFLLIVLGMAVMPQPGMAQSSLRTSSPVPPQVELMYVKGLRFLQNAQKTDGTYEGTYGQEPGIIGFCLMSVLAHGDDPNTGRTPPWCAAASTTFSPSRTKVPAT